MDINEVRRQNLRKLVSKYQGMNALARQLGLTKGAYISQLLTNPPTRNLSEKTARKWEKELSLPEGYLDGRSQGAAQGEPALAINADLLAGVLAEVTEAARQAKVSMTTEQVAELVAMQYSDAAASGRVDPERIRAILRLVSR